MEEKQSGAGDWLARVDTLGDTITVHTEAGSVWGPTRLVEELRIGAAEGAEHETFGRVAALAVAANGDILVYDAQATALRRYRTDGSYAGTIGRAGSGPGEYRNVTGVGILPDGRIVLNDFGNTRYNFYDAGGGFLTSWLLSHSIAERRPVYVRADGTLFLQDLQIQGDEAVNVIATLDTTGRIIETRAIPESGNERAGITITSERGSFGRYLPFTAEDQWTMTPAGEFLFTAGTQYRIEARRPDGGVLRISRAFAPVSVTAAEKMAAEQEVTRSIRRLVPDWTWSGARIPDYKPPIRWLHAGLDSTIWVATAQPGTVSPETDATGNARSNIHEPVLFDVYDAAGRLLGSIQAPEGFALQPYPVLKRDAIWAVVRDDNGVDYVVRFRVDRD